MKVLYLSYDGMTDPLGQSQVIPYLAGLSAKGHEITLLSCEKPDRLDQSEAEIRRLLGKSGIRWVPLAYLKRPPLVSTLRNVRALRLAAEQAVARDRYDIAHCRSYLPALVGMRLKKRFGLKFLFDMRGFWADERVDGKIWDLKNPLYRAAYRYFKQKEIEFLNSADRIVTLTHAGKAEMQKWKIAPEVSARIHVIPCCADLAHFRREAVNELDRKAWRQKLNLSESDRVVTYLGSLGTWYLLEEMLRFFKMLAQSRSGTKLFFITPDDPGLILEAAAREGVAPEQIRIQKASRGEVPVLLSLTQLGLFFIRPSYSKIASSATKMAEYLAMGVPVIANAGVGDNEWLAARYPIGALVADLKPESWKHTVADLDRVHKLAPEALRAVAQEYFSLENGVEEYHRIYSLLARDSGSELK